MLKLCVEYHSVLQVVESNDGKLELEKYTVVVTAARM